ncbi:MAG: hypothetical protein RL754_286 [Bacteroidota bacterium]|jgi:hypothetical protein
MHKYVVVLGFFLTNFVSPAQSFEPEAPLDIPLVLSGTFAELRSNHFHGGIDIKTQGRSGLKVKSISDGYISRISISPYGYGNALYVRHPEGYTSVYGHLMTFAPAIEQWVEQTLRDRGKNDGNLYPDANLFPVEKGEFIAFSGNTGGSMGPHLHFEIRDTRTEEPLNPLSFGFKVEDTRRPDVRGLMWTDADFQDHGTFSSGDTIEMSGTRGFDVFTTDKQNGANNNNGVYKLKAQINGIEFFSALYDRINFNTTRYINAHMNFERYYHQGVRYTRLYTLENNELQLCQTPEVLESGYRASNGWITMNKDSIAKVDISIEDFAGNESTVHFYLKGTAVEDKPSNDLNILQWDVDNVLSVGPIQVSIPAGALYRDTEFKTFELRDAEYVIGQGVVPLQKHMELSWQLDSARAAHEGWFAWELGRNGNKDAITGKREGNVLVLSTRSTGTYYLDQDLKKPVLRLVQSTPMLRSGSTYREYRIHVEDDKTGIERYSARIDEAFARIDFDYKRNLLKVVIPEDIEPGSHNLRIVAIDGVGNTATETFTVTL